MSPQHCIAELLVPSVQAPAERTLTLKRLLARGFFLEKIPPCYSTEKYAECLVKNGSYLPSSFRTQSETQLLHHSCSRTGGLRRNFAIQNPVTFFALAQVCSDEWDTLSDYLSSSPFAMSQPTIKENSPRSVSPKCTATDLIAVRAQTRSRGRYLIKADISDCYHSIDTCSLERALEKPLTGRRVRAPEPDALGARLALLTRCCQNSQTVGIPIGPDTSFITAEIVLTAVDNILAAAVKPIGFRYVDGFEFCCWHYSEAESTLSALQAALLEYNLRPNPRKTAILPLPQSMESKWLSELRAIHIRTNANGQSWDLVRLFDRAFEFSGLFPEEPVLKFLAARIAELRIDQCNHAMVQALLLQVMACEPSVIPEVLRALIVLSEQAFEIDTRTLGRILNGIIASQAPLGHDDEVAWALWGCLRFRISLDSTTAKELAGVDNSIVAVLSLDAKAQELAPTLDTGFWQGFMDSDELYGPRWLLCYEANVHKWLPSVRQGDHVAKDPNFAFMKQKGVRFYALVTDKSPIPYANIRPVGAFW